MSTGIITCDTMKSTPNSDATLQQYCNEHTISCNISSQFHNCTNITDYTDTIHIVLQYNNNQLRALCGSLDILLDDCNHYQNNFFINVYINFSLENNVCNVDFDTVEAVYYVATVTARQCRDGVGQNNVTVTLMAQNNGKDIPIQKLYIQN